MSDFNFNSRCEDLLNDYKRTSGDRVAKRLEDIRGALKRAGYETVQTMFGGSVKRGTYVSGLSDEDTLLVVNQTPFVNRPSSVVVRQVKNVIQDHLPNNCVTTGGLAVTIKYRKGPEIQILPAIRTDSSGVQIAAPGRSGWSNVTDPEAFARKLTQVDKANGSRVLPVIKLAKSLADCHINNKQWKISGYHMEALAVDAFKDYKGAKQNKPMLDHFMAHVVDAVMSPIDDLTLQSRYVDGNLDAANSNKRQQASKRFENLRGRVRNCNTVAKFNRLFGR